MKGERRMAKDYFKESKAITNTVLEYMERNHELNDDLYYTIDILNIDGDAAKVMICGDPLYLAKDGEQWLVPLQEVK